MRCPGCGLYHPPQYENCVSCGASLGTVSPADNESGIQTALQTAIDTPPATAATTAERRAHQPHRRYSGLPTSTGIAIAVSILLLSGGATFFFLTRASDDQVLLNQGLRELSGGQYAFAVKSLEKACALNPKNAKVYLALARAYIGVEKIDQAWDAIGQAQQLGTGVVADPTLASELANYYRQRRQYERAIELLRPLAEANIPGKKAELADLDALCGDEALRDGNYELALKSWEEARDLKEGVRYTEADTRLSTIYQKMADKLLLAGNDEQALALLNKLNNLTENAANLERTADIYERQNKLDLAIDHLRHAIRLSGNNTGTNAKLAALLSRYGKQLLDEGDTNGGWGYLQQAQALDPKLAVPVVTLRNTSVSVDSLSREPQIMGEIWNPGTQLISDLSMRVELIDTKTSQVIWQQNQRVIDEFVAPLAPQSSKPFASTALATVKPNGSSSFRIYINGQLYKTYRIGTPDPNSKAAPAASPAASTTSSPIFGNEPKVPAAAPKAVPPESVPQPAPAYKPAAGTEDQSNSPEDQTLNDLDR